jgi:HEXXH motif-containing protein
VALSGYAKLAAPQADGSDTLELKRLARLRWPRVSPVEGLAFIWTKLAAGPLMLPEMKLAEFDDARVWQAAVALKRWKLAPPLTALIDSFIPHVSTTAGEGRGCSSGHQQPTDENGNLTISVTVNDPTGCAEGIVHEIAHQRLHVLGIDLEQHDGVLFNNDGAAVHFSPIRRDVPRPFSALLHGVYAWSFMLGIDLAAVGHADGEQRLAVNMPKTKLGLEILEDAAEPTTEGRNWLHAFLGFAWFLVDEAEVLLRERRIALVPVPQKEW